MITTAIATEAASIAVTHDTIETSTIPQPNTTPAVENKGSCSVFTLPCIDSCTVSVEERQQVLLDLRNHHGGTSGVTLPSSVNGSETKTGSKTAKEATTTSTTTESRGVKSGCALAEKCVSSCAAYGRVCPCAARIAAHAACKSIQELVQDSLIFTDERESSKNTLPVLNAEDIVMQEKLGEGGFSNVNACTILRHSEEMMNGDETKLKLNEPKLYAIKYLTRRSMVDLHQFKHGAADLAVEAFFLHKLSHPNIIKLHGVTAGSVETAVATGKECGYFIVIDRLVKTLEQTIDEWNVDHSGSHHHGNHHTGMGLLSRVIPMSAECKLQKKQVLHTRIKIASSIANALSYLHSKNIIYRDLKPDNIGFDYNGTIKIFDFGLAKELKPKYQLPDGRYKLTGVTGSRRYMSPEVALDQPYDLSVDVYAFGILLWEMCTAEKPFQGYSANRHMKEVVLNNERPKLEPYSRSNLWPPNLSWLIQQCWSKVSAARPSFVMVQQILDDILNDQSAIPTSLIPTKTRSILPSPSKILRPAKGIPKSKTTSVVSSGKTTNKVTKQTDVSSDSCSADDEPCPSEPPKSPPPLSSTESHKAIQETSAMGKSNITLPWKQSRQQKTQPFSPMSQPLRSRDQQNHQRVLDSGKPFVELAGVDTDVILHDSKDERNNTNSSLPPPPPGHLRTPAKNILETRARTWGFGTTNSYSNKIDMNRFERNDLIQM